ncbi:MAG: hypothetical protein ACR2NR_02045 [Solirubrobacteraceae bacterium]
MPERDWSAIACRTTGWRCFAPSGLTEHSLWNLVGNPVETTLAAAHLVLSGTLARHRALQGSDHPFDMADPDPVATVRAAGLSDEQQRGAGGQRRARAADRGGGVRT